MCGKVTGLVVVVVKICSLPAVSAFVKSVELFHDLDWIVDTPYLPHAP